MSLGNSEKKAKETLRENPVLMAELRQKILEKRGLAGGTSGDATANGQLPDQAQVPVKVEKADKGDEAEKADEPDRPKRSRRASASAD